MNKFAYANAIFEDDVDNRSHDEPLEALKLVLDLSSLVWAIYSRNIMAFEETKASQLIMEKLLAVGLSFM